MELFEIKPDLFQGSKMDDYSLIRSRGIDTIIDLEGGFDNISGWLIEGSYLYWHIYDAPWLPNINRLWVVADYGYKCWQIGDKVLVHCTQGKNRSGLVVGCILSLSGMKGPEIVNMIREKRPGALFNPVFSHYLESL